MKQFDLAASVHSVGKIFQKSSHEYMLHPYRDWAVLLVVFIGILGAIIFWSIYLFQGVASGDFFGESTVVPRSGDTVDRSRLDKALNEFQERSARAELVGESQQLSDPSE